MSNPVEFLLALAVGVLLAVATYSVRLTMLLRTAGEADENERASFRREAFGICAIAVVVYVGAHHFGLG